MIKLFGFGPQFGLVDPSPFVLKVDALLRLTQTPFEVITNVKNLSNAPKKKLPYIEDQGKNIADSHFIFEYIKTHHDQELDTWLSPGQKATAHLTSRALDEAFYYCLIYSRWCRDDTWPIVKQAFFGGMPALLRHIIAGRLRKQVINGLKDQGFGRHSHEEILQLTHQSLQALNDLLGDKPYMLGEHMCSLDATCFAFLAQMILAEIDNPYNAKARSYSALVQYCQRIHQQLYE